MTPQEDPSDDSPELVRLNKYLADQGIASRRKCDELIAGGRVAIDGRVVTQLGTKIDPQAMRIEVEGVELERGPAAHRYYLLNKPRGVVCTNEAREARMRAIDMITDPKKGRIYTVGRLDEESQGLILLTNDGEFTNRVSHPRHGVTKTYWAKVRGRVDPEVLERIRSGVHLAEGHTSGADLRVEKRTNEFTILMITLREGKNREVRRVFAKVGFKVLALRRIRIGNLTDRHLREGDWRPLTRAEVDDLLGIARGERTVEPLGRGRLPHRKGFSQRRKRPGGKRQLASASQGSHTRSSHVRGRRRAR